MIPRASKKLAVRRLAALAAALLAVTCATSGPKPDRTVRATVQMHPGGPVETAPMGVYEVPVDPPLLSAAEAGLADDDLVLGVVVDGEAMAWPIRYVALSEIVNNRVADTPLAATW